MDTCLYFFNFKMQSFIYKETKQKTEKMKWKMKKKERQKKKIGDRKEK